MQLGVGWSAPVLNQVENQIRTWQIEYTIINTTKFNSQKLKEVFRFQSPSMSHLSIPYLTIMDIQLEVSSIRGHPLPLEPIEK